MTRLLILNGLVERVSLPGERRAYFRLKPNAWTNLMGDRLATISAGHRLVERGLGLLSGRDPTVRRRPRGLVAGGLACLR